jgi:pimeloyl-ACP methyl ester carboxylesterase
MSSQEVEVVRKGYMGDVMKDLVLFVHGFGSSPGCWEPLMALLQRDPRITSRYDLETFSYPTSWFSLNRLNRIPSLKELGRLLGARIDSKNWNGRNLTLVGHSQGGLVIQSWMADLLQGQASRLGNLNQVLLIATPNAGSVTGLNLRRLASMLFTNPQELTLRVLSRDVAELQSIIRNSIVYSTEDSTVSWRVPIHAFAGLQDNVVPEASARGCFESVTPMPGNHFTILRPSNEDDDRYCRIAERLTEPGGHLHRFDIDLHQTVLRVEPRNRTEMRVEIPSNPRIVVYDNYAFWKRTIRFAGSNRCADNFMIRYKTGKEGYVRANPSHTNIAPPEEIGRWMQDGTEFRFDFSPDSRKEYSLEVEVYKGFDEGEREMHFHLGKKGLFRNLECIINLSAYVKAGWQITAEPRCYFDNSDHPCNERCRDRSERNNIVPTRSSLSDGEWEFRLTDVREGGVNLVWDVSNPSE